jgi:hypothetical protein
MAKQKGKPKVSRKVEINVDTPNVDLSYTKNEEGDVHVDLETPKMDLSIDKTEEKVSIQLDSFEDGKRYSFESNGKSRFMPKGTIWKISGAMLKVFLQKKLGNVINK